MRRHAVIIAGLLHRGAVQGSVKLARFDIPNVRAGKKVEKITIRSLR
jgi:hypothetical protein